MTNLEKVDKIITEYVAKGEWTSESPIALLLQALKDQKKISDEQAKTIDALINDIEVLKRDIQWTMDNVDEIATETRANTRQRNNRYEF